MYRYRFMQMLTIKNNRFLSFILTAIWLSISTYSYAGYAPKINSAANGYKIKLDGNATVSQSSITGTDGKLYYKIGNDIVIDKNSTSVTSVGDVICVGRQWGNSGWEHILSDSVYHRLFNYAPSAGFTLNGRTAYRINNNVVMTVRSYMDDWVRINAPICSDLSWIYAEYITAFTAQFPITFEFYLNKKIIDGQIMVPAMDLAGYVRAFVEPFEKPPYDSWPIHETTAPIRLLPSQLNIPASCKTTTSTGQPGTLNLRHGQLNALQYDSQITGQINFTCEFSKLTKVRLQLDYAKDDDPQKRLPLINKTTKSKIYSTLIMSDESTGQSGLDINVNIEQLKTISIKSHLRGSNASEGDYQGSAWLIATFL